MESRKSWRRLMKKKIGIGVGLQVRILDHSLRIRDETSFFPPSIAPLAWILLAWSFVCFVGTSTVRSAEPDAPQDLGEQGLKAGPEKPVPADLEAAARRQKEARARFPGRLWQVPWRVEMAGARPAINPMAAQIGGPATSEEEDDDEYGERVFASPNREVLLRVARAEELARQRRFGEAVRLLSSILEGSDDALFKPKPTAPYASLKTEAARILMALPEEGLASYELQFGALAGKLLREAVAKGDLHGLNEIVRRFYFTTAGQQAAFTLAQSKLDDGESFAAALLFEKLRNSPSARQRFEPLLSFKMAVAYRLAGSAADYQRVLAELSASQPNLELEIQGRKRKIFANPSNLGAVIEEFVLSPAELGSKPKEDWVMFRGNSARNASVAAGRPMSFRRWTVPTTVDPKVEQALAETRERQLEDGKVLLPGCHPLAVGSFVYMRTLAGLQAVDFRTGKRVWHGAIDPMVEETLDSLGQDGNSVVNTDLNRWLRQRLFDDSIYGTLSSDGSNVYCVEDLGVTSGPSLDTNPRTIVLNNGAMDDGGGLAIVGHNRLAAYEIASEGKLKWELFTDSERPDQPLDGAFYLGPPTPVGDRLYVLAEIKNEIRLLALKPDSGELEWSLRLAVVERGILDDDLRRFSGAMPSYAEGILICPTAAGAIVAVDLTSRSLRWGHRFGRPQDRVARQFFGQPDFFLGYDSVDENRWNDSTVTIAEGVALVTGWESDELQCLDLASGALRWKADRGDGRFLACVQDGVVLVVEPRAIRALKISDGAAAWGNENKAEAGVQRDNGRVDWNRGSISLPGASVSTGQGFVSGDKYWLPTSAGQILTIDIKTGAYEVVPLSRGEFIAGNLICHRGAILSLDAEGLTCFAQREFLGEETAKALAKNASDPRALAAQGELALEEGNFAGAAEALRASLAAAPNARARQILVEALLAGLKSDFSGRRDSIQEIETLLDLDSQKLRFLLLQAEGWREANEPLAAVSALIRLLDMENGGSPLSRQSPWHAASPGQLARARLAEWKLGMDSNSRDALTELLSSRWAAVRDAQEFSRIADFASDFAGYPFADDALAEFLKRGVEEKRWSRVEHTLALANERKPLPSQGETMARLARMYDDAGRDQDAIDCYRRLAAEFDEVPLEKGLTGKQIVDRLAADSPLRARLSRPDPFLIGDTKLEKSDSNVTISPPTPIPIRGSRAPHLVDMIFEWHEQDRSIHALDALGKTVWTVPAAKLGRLADDGEFPTKGVSVRGSGKYLYFSLGYQVVALDTSRAERYVSPETLWVADLVDTLPSPEEEQMRQFGRMNVRVRQRIMIQGQRRGEFFGVANSSPTGAVALANARLVCFQRGKKLIALDPRSGAPLWTRFGIVPHAEILGDEEYVFVISTNPSEMIALRAADGEELLRRAHPSGARKPLMAIGRLLFDTGPANNRNVIRCHDLWEDKTVWELAASAGAHFFDGHLRTIGVLDPLPPAEGQTAIKFRFLLLSAVDGRPLVDSVIEEETRPTRETVIHGATTYSLLTKGGENAIHGTQFGVPAEGTFLVDGQVHGFDKATGKHLFSTPVKNQHARHDQPRESPVLVFARNRVPSQQDNSNQAGTYGVTCLDRRTGRIVYEHEGPGNIPGIETELDVTAQTFKLRDNRTEAVITFTNDPPPAIVPAEKPMASGAAAAAGAVFRGLRNWIGGENGGYGEYVVERAPPAIETPLGDETGGIIESGADGRDFLDQDDEDDPFFPSIAEDDTDDDDEMDEDDSDEDAFDAGDEEDSGETDPAPDTGDDS